MSMLSAGRVAAIGVSAAAITGGSPALAEVHEVQQIDIQFVPDEITVAPGDTVQWIWNDGFHTVTSSGHEDCEFDGLYFNESLFSGNPLVEWKVPNDLSGPVPYVCIPHCGFDMFGVINVEIAPDCPGDIDASGTVDFDDLLVVLSGWGPCPTEDCPGDLDESGRVDFDDLLIVLSNYGPCD